VHSAIWRFLILTGAVALAGALPAQQAGPLTLQQAVNVALEKSPDYKMVQADAAAARVATQAARTALLPSLGYTESATRGNDPVYAFGTRLRQQRFTQDNFALDSLNKPAPLNNFTSRFTVNWNAFDSLRTERQISAAKLQQHAAESMLSRADQLLVYRVIAGYHAVLLAGKHLEVARHEEETAQALLDLSKTRVQAGLAVDSDQLIASTNLAERRQELIAAEGGVSMAWADLERILGTPISEEQRHLAPLPEQDFEAQPLDAEIAMALKSRSDRQSMQDQTAAQQANLRAATSAYGPSLNAYGSWEADRTSFAGSGGNNWMAGAELRIDLFPAGKRAQVSAARIAVDKARSAQTAAEDQIRLEVTRAWFAHRTAAQQMAVAHASIAQADESLRIIKNRYEAGLSLITEMLRVEDAQRQSSAAYWQAVYANAVTWADLKLATGTLHSTIEDLQ
jgi:outer membrane protein